ncbi:MAG: amidohydrolase family protein, partial [Candidatus Heimdallarchaeota archaeon]|nr:amidohydrolase family protein [Candidatus Heimdallarchaeota archaeon]
VRQGITSVVTGNCGYSLAPIIKEKVEEFEDIINGFNTKDQRTSVSWSSFAEYLEYMKSVDIAVNLLPLVGFISIRFSILGMENRDPTDAEVSQMQAMVEESMKAGAFGFSTGLIYAPQMYSKTPEIIKLAELSGKYNGMYFSHIRNEGDDQINAITEFLEIVKYSGCRSGQLSHHKIAGEKNWGMSKDTLKLVRDQVLDGLQVRIDQYPYIAGSNMLSDSLPGWVREGGIHQLLSRLQNEELLEKIKTDMESTEVGKLRWDKIFVSHVLEENWKQYEGDSIEEIASKLSCDPFDAFIRIIIENKGNVGKIAEYGHEDDVEQIMKDDLTMFGTDCSVTTLNKGKPHPRSYGTYPRILGKYSREQGVLSFEHAIRKMTSYPAQTMGIFDRGLIREGMYADIVILDKDKVIDRATYRDPHQYPDGIVHVLVNGKLVVENNLQTENRPGKIITRHDSAY